ncbi:MAG: hypothetical protein ACRCXC_06035 [Legionella sp.]
MFDETKNILGRFVTRLPVLNEEVFYIKSIRSGCANSLATLKKIE